MGSSKKRKRDVLETPRITYDTPTRIFDRLFKEDSLDELKDTVRKKLGVPSSTAIHLTQLRDGTAVDLEDDDDFDAFQSTAYSTLVARVKVVVGGSDQPVHVNGVEQVASQSEVVESISTISTNERKKHKKKKSSPDSSRAATPTPEPVAEDAPDVHDERPTKKRRVSFAAPSAEILSSLTESKNKEKSKNTDRPGKSQDSSATTPAAATSNVVSVKRKKKKKQKTVPPEGDALEEPVEDVEPVADKTLDDKKRKSKDKHVDAADASVAEVITDAEVGRKGSKSKKRARSRSPERPDEISEPISSISAVAETPLRAAKKLKQGAKDLDATQTGNSESAPAPAVSVEPFTELQTVPPKGKKGKKKQAPKETEEPAESDPPVASLSPEKGPPVVEPAAVVDKYLKKKQAKSSIETEKTSEVPPATATQKGGKKDSNSAKPAEHAQSAASEKKSSKESTDAPGPTVSSSAKPTSSAVSMGSLIADMLARRALKQLGTGEEDTATASKAITDAAPKIPAAIDTPPSHESTVSVPAPETEKPAPTKAPAAIEASSSKESTTTIDTNASKTAKPTSSKSAQDKPATGKAPRLTPAQRKKAPCPVCDETPFHARNRCPLIKTGVRAMRKRIKELEESDVEEHAELIEELRALIDKRTKKSKTPAANGVHAQTEEHTDVQAEVDNGASKSTEATAAAAPSTKTAPVNPKAPAKATQPTQHESSESSSSDEEESPPAEPSRSPSPPPPPAQSRPTALKSPVVPSKGLVASSSQKKQAQKPVPKKSRGYDRDSSQLLDTSDVSLAAIGLPGGLLGFDAGDVSTFTEADIEALIRGPRPSLNSRNLASSSSSSGGSEDEDEPGADVVMEDEEGEEKSEKAQRAARRMSKLAARDDSSDEEVVPVGVRGHAQEDDDDDSDSSADGDVTLRRNVIAASKVQPSVTPSARASEVPDESVPSPSTSSSSATGAGEHSFRAVNGRATSQVLDTSVSDAVNDIISADIGIVSPVSEVKDEGQAEVDSQESKAEAEPATAQVDESVVEEPAAPEVAASEEPEPVTADSPSSESSESSADTNEADPIEVEAPQPSQGDPIHSDADEDKGTPALAESTPKAKVTARQTRSQRSKAEPANTTTTTAASTTADTNPPSSTPKPKTTAAVPAASSQLSQSVSRSEPPKVSRKSSRPMTKISEMPVPPHPHSGVRIIKPAQVAVVARTTRSKSAAASEPAEDQDEGDTPAPEPEAEPEPSVVPKRGRRAGSVAPKTPAKPTAAKTPGKVTRAASKQALASSQTPAPTTTAKAAPKTSAKPPSKVGGKSTVYTRTTAKARASQLTADLGPESEDSEEGEEQNTTINGHAPTQNGKKAGDQSLAAWSVLPDRSSVAADLTAIESSPTRNMVDELVSSPRAATPKVTQASQQAEADAQEGDGAGTEEAWQSREDPLFLYDESQQSFPYSQYPGLVPKQGQEDSDDDEEDDAGSTILKDSITEITKPRPSGPFRSLTEISSQSQRDFFAPRYSSQLANIGKPAVKDMYGGITGDDDDEGSDGSDSESDSEAEHKANNSHIPETRRAGVSSKRK